MQSDQTSVANRRRFAVGSAGSGSELDGLRATCRRQAETIDALGEAVKNLRRGAQALKAENAALRAETNGGRGHGGRRIEASLEPDLQAPGAARTLVADHISDRVDASVLANAQLLVSEMVTNSVRHSDVAVAGHIIVSVELTPAMVRLDVEDPGCSGAIAPHPPDAEIGGGFGLNLVQALSERWGIERVALGGTRVWAQLGRAPLTAA